jgi:hypothetical protein
MPRITVEMTPLIMDTHLQDEDKLEIKVFTKDGEKKLCIMVNGMTVHRITNIHEVPKVRK